MRSTILVAAVATLAAGTVSVGLVAPAQATPAAGAVSAGSTIAVDPHCAGNGQTDQTRQARVRANKTATVSTSRKFTMTSIKDRKDTVTAVSTSRTSSRLVNTGGSFTSASIITKASASYRSARKSTACKKAQAQTVVTASTSFTLTQDSVLKPSVVGDVTGSGFCILAVSQADSEDWGWSMMVASGPMVSRPPAASSTFTAPAGDYEVFEMCVIDAGGTSVRASRIATTFTLSASPVAP